MPPFSGGTPPNPVNAVLDLTDKMLPAWAQTFAGHGAAHIGHTLGHLGGNAASAHVGHGAAHIGHGGPDAAHAHAGHDPEKIRKHDDAGKDRLFEGRIQRDDADKESDRNRLEKDVARHHHTPDEVGTLTDTDTHPKK